MLEKATPAQLLTTLQNTTNLKESNKCLGCNQDAGEFYAYCPACRIIEKAKREAAENANRCDRLLAAMPPYYKKMTFSNFLVTDRNRAAFQSAQGFCSAGNRGLYIWGGCGVGKTHLAAAVWQEAVSRFIPVRFVPSSELMMKLRKSFDDKDGKTDDEIIDYYAEPEILAIDDLGTDRPSPFCVESIYLLINRRLAEMKYKMIITSNLSLKQVAGTLGDRIASRLAEMVNVVEIKDTDHRMGEK